LQQFSRFLFQLLGLTAFLLPLFLVQILFFKHEKVKKILKYSLLIWMPVLLNLALVRDILEIKTNLGGITVNIFTYAHDHRIDFIFILLPIIAINFLVLYLLGVDIPKIFKRMKDAGSKLIGH
jgi:hypothetical protein